MFRASLMTAIVLAAGGVVAAPATTPQPKDFLRRAILDGPGEDSVAPLWPRRWRRTRISSGTARFAAPRTMRSLSMAN